MQCNAHSPRLQHFLLISILLIRVLYILSKFSIYICGLLRGNRRTFTYVFIMVNMTEHVMEKVVKKGEKRRQAAMIEGTI